MINVLIVDDDAMVAELNRLYVGRVSGFRCSGTASTLSKAREMVNDKDLEIDLVLLDVYMQQDSRHTRVRAGYRRDNDYLCRRRRDGSGLDALRRGGLSDQTLPVSTV